MQNINIDSSLTSVVMRSTGTQLYLQMSKFFALQWLSRIFHTHEWIRVLRSALVAINWRSLKDFPDLLQREEFRCPALPSLTHLAWVSCMHYRWTCAFPPAKVLSRAFYLSVYCTQFCPAATKNCFY